MSQLLVPYYAQAAGDTIEIDGVTYRVGRVDPGGRLLVSLDVDADDIRLANENYSAAQTNNELIAAPGAGLVIYVTGIFFSTDAIVTMKLTQSSGSPADVFGPHYFPADGGISAPTLSAPIALNANSALRVTTVGVSNATITILAKVM